MMVFFFSLRAKKNHNHSDLLFFFLWCYQICTPFSPVGKMFSDGSSLWCTMSPDTARWIESLSVCRKETTRTLWTPCSISQSVGCWDFYRSGQMPRLDRTEAAGGGLTADGKPETTLLFTSQLHFHFVAVWWALTRSFFGCNFRFDIFLSPQCFYMAISMLAGS